MRLKQYLEDNEINYSEAARQMGVGHGSQVRRWALPFATPYSVFPSDVNLVKIFLWSGGQVTPNDWFDGLIKPMAQNSEQAHQLLNTIDERNNYDA